MPHNQGDIPVSCYQISVNQCPTIRVMYLSPVTKYQSINAPQSRRYTCFLLPNISQSMPHNQGDIPVSCYQISVNQCSTIRVMYRSPVTKYQPINAPQPRRCTGHLLPNISQSMPHNQGDIPVTCYQISANQCSTIKVMYRSPIKRCQSINAPQLR